MDLYELASLASGSGFLAMTETAPAAGAFNPVTGWTVSGTFSTAVASGRSAEIDSQVRRATSAFVVDNNLPGAPNSSLGNGFRTPNPLTGNINPGNWSIAASFIANSAFNGRFRVRWRVYKGKAADGSDAVEIGGGLINSPATTANLSTSVGSATTLTATWNAPQVELDNDYLFFTAAIEMTSKASDYSTQGIDMVAGPSAVVATPDLVVGYWLMGMVGI